MCKVFGMAERKRGLLPLIIEKVQMPVWLYNIVGIDFTDPKPLLDPWGSLRQMLGKTP